VRIGIDARKLHDYGIGTYIRNLLRELAKLDQRTEYVLLTKPQHMNVAQTLGENFRAVPDSSGQYSIAEQISVPFAVRRERLDLFHATHYVLPALTPSKSVVTIHDCIHLMFPEYMRHRLGYVYARASLYTAVHKSDRIFTVSEQSKRDILKFFNVPPDKIIVTPNAIDDRFSVPPSEEHVVQTRERYQLSQSYLLYVGNIKPHKNLERLIEAFHLVRSQGRSELELIIIGDEISKLQSLRRAVHKYDIHRSVRFLGYVPDKTLAVLYRLASVFVFPSLYEGFGLPPLEAMASGTPVVTSNVSSLPEVVGDAAVLVDPYSAEAIADGILAVLRSTHLREDLRARGLERAQEYSWARSVQRVREIYREVLG
jgi:glycosyltransferase involved in cell wall biosynthesis